MSDLFCRHNRFTADCPICSRGTVLEPRAAGERRPSSRPAGAAPAARRDGDGTGAVARGAGGRRAPFRGPYASAGPYERAEGRYEVRLERVPGGLRLAEWSGGQLARRAPVLAAGDLRRLLREACERGFVRGRDADRLAAALAATEEAAGPGGAASADGAPAHGASSGRSGELADELRVEHVGADRVRVARWIRRPGAGWELQEAPTMLPAARYAEALVQAAGRGLG